VICATFDIECGAGAYSESLVTIRGLFEWESIKMEHFCPRDFQRVGETFAGYNGKDWEHCHCGNIRQVRRDTPDQIAFDRFMESERKLHESDIFGILRRQ
jgi:hypothetical protein